MSSENRVEVTDTEAWKKFLYELNNPTPEVAANRKRFFEECGNLMVTRSDDSISVESEMLNAAEIIAKLYSDRLSRDIKED